MAWFRLEGRGAFHHKVLAAGNEAYGAWCRAGQWSSDQLTDGFVPAAVAEQIAKAKVWAKLVEARLVHEDDGGYRIHDFLDWNPSSEQEREKREAMREKRREAGKIGGKRSGEARRGEANAKQTGSTDEANPKQSASRSGEANAKQNEAPNPNPNPISEDQIPPNPPLAGGGASEGQRPDVPEPPAVIAPARRPAARRRAEPLALPGVGASAADDVFTAFLAAWARVVGKGAPPVLDDKRRKRVAYWVAQGVTVDRLKAAVAGIFESDWHTAPENRGHLTFEVAMRDGGQIDKFAALHEAARSSARPQERPAWLNQRHAPRRGLLREVEAMRADGVGDDPFAGLEDSLATPPGVP